MRGAEVVVAGHVCIDLVPTVAGPLLAGPGQLADIGPLAFHAGGCVANTGLGLAALGTDVALGADVGDDDLGALLRALLEHPRADTGAVRSVPGDTSYSIVVEPPGLDRSFWHHIGANSSFDGSQLIVDGARLVHLGYPTMLPRLHTASGARFLALLDEIRRHGATTSVDLSTFEPGSPAALEDWPRLLGRCLPSVDVVSASLDDLSCALGADAVAAATPCELARDLVALGAAVAVVKAGAGGLHLATAAEDRLARAGHALAPLARAWASVDLAAPSIPVDVVTTTGAGDAAVAGLLHGLSRGMGPADTLNAAAATAAARVNGARSLPGWAELARRFAGQCVVEEGVQPGGTRC